MSNEHNENENLSTPVSKSRGPAYPYLDLGRALERIQQIADKGLSTRQAVPPSTIYGYWDMGIKSSASRQSMAALKYYGLIEYVGSGRERRVRLTDTAMVLAHDKDSNSERRKEALRKAALSPEIFSEIYEKEGGPYLPKDEALILGLTLDGGFDRSSAEKAIRHFLSTIELAGLDQPGSSPSEATKKDVPEFTDGVKYGGASIGDLVQWESQGVLQLEKPLRVTQLSSDGDFVAVEGYNTWLPMSQIIIEQSSPAVPPQEPPNIDGEDAPKPKPQIANMKEDTFTTLEGDVSIIWPISLSSDSLEDVGAWTTLILKKIKREIDRRDRDTAAEFDE